MSHSSPDKASPALTEKIKTVDLAGAAKILKASKETVRLKAKAGEIPGRKAGKQWVFSELALQRYLMGEWVPRVVEGRKEVENCHSTNEKAAPIGTTGYPLRGAESQYRAALAPKIKSRRRNSTTG